MGGHMIREVAADLGVTLRTLRFYEQKGLVNPGRIGDRRLYSDADVARLRQIREWTTLGFALDTIYDLLRRQDEAPEHLQTALRTAAYDRLSRARQERDALTEQIGKLEAMLTRESA